MLILFFYFVVGIRRFDFVFGVGLKERYFVFVIGVFGRKR